MKIRQKGKGVFLEQQKIDMKKEQIKEYEQKEAALFSSWKQKPPYGMINHRDHVWVADGILCPEQWFSQPVRPLFLLKEAYGGTEDWDLRQLLLKGEDSLPYLPKMWQRVSLWAKGLLETTAGQIAPFAQGDDCKSFGNDYLRQCAVMNLKKSNGKSHSTREELEAYVAYDRQELLEQLSLIRPTILVCGYTASLLFTLWEKQPQKNENWFTWVSFQGEPLLVLDYYHPANAFPDLLNYYGLMGIYQQALLTQKVKKPVC